MVGGEKSSNIINELIFTKIFQAFRMAIQPTKFIITFSSLAILCILGRVMDFFWQFITTEEVSTGGYEGVFSTTWSMSATRFQGAVDAVFAFNVPALVNNITDYFKTIGLTFKDNFIYCIIFSVAALIVFSIGGGAICRIAALQVAKGEKPGLTGAIRFSLKKFVSFFTTPLAPVVIVIFIGFFIFILGLLGNIPRAGELIVSFGLPMALIAGVLITVVVIGIIAGFNLMFPAVAYDGSDCFDAISRSFSYIYSRPWHMLFYTSIAAIYGSICYMFVRSFAFLALWSTRWSIRLGLWAKDGSGQLNKLNAVWPEPEFLNLAGSTGAATTNWTESLSALIIYLLVLIVIGLVVSFVINFYFSANTIIYSLMRNKVDDTALEDIYIPLEEQAELSDTIGPPTSSTQTQTDTQNQSE